MSRRWRTLVAGALAIGSLLPVGTPPAAAATPAAKRLFVVSDSVGLGAVNALTAKFAGWQVTVAGKAGLFTEQLVRYVSSAPSGAFGESAVVATGYNYPYWDAPRFDHSVDLMVAALKARGVRRIFWVTMREVTPVFYPRWNTLEAAYRTLYLAYPGANDRLRRATTRHPELSIIDWAANADVAGLTYDAIHLNPTGAARYANLAYSTVTTGASRAAAGAVRAIPVLGRSGVPLDAVAVSVNVTVVNPRSSGHVTLYPCGAAVPTVSTINTRAATTMSNGAIVVVGVAGSICVTASVATHVVIDVNGAFSPTSGFVALSPARAKDTRPGAVPTSGATIAVPLASIPGAPPVPFTAVLNLTVLATANGAVRVFTCGAAVPKLPSMAYVAGQIRNSSQLVRTDALGKVCVTTTGGADVIVDLMGALDRTADIRPTTLRRLLDTRSGVRVAAGATVRIPVAGVGGTPSAPPPSGALLSLTIVSPADSGYAVAFPCAGGAPRTALVNFVANRSGANAGVVGIDSSGAVCVRSNVATHLVVDYGGWVGSGLTTFPPARVLDTRAG